MYRYLVILALVLCGCAATTKLVPIEYELVDNPERSRIELTYRNESDTTMCLLPEHWPNAAGKINQASGYVYLIVGREQFPIENFNTGYCPQGCARHVAPGERVTAFFRYSDFDLPSHLSKQPKSLHFSPKAFRCESKET